MKKVYIPRLRQSENSEMKLKMDYIPSMEEFENGDLKKMDFRKSTYDGRETFYFDFKYNFINTEIFSNVMNGKFVKIEKDLIQDTDANIVNLVKDFFYEKYEKEEEKKQILEYKRFKLKNYKIRPLFIYELYNKLNENENKQEQNAINSQENDTISSANLEKSKKD